ncbi:MAG: hypothetical protein ACI97P_000487 [Arcticibacterium sp.]|jgi:hypothetical protein
MRKTVLPIHGVNGKITRKACWAPAFEFTSLEQTPAHENYVT